MAATGAVPAADQIAYATLISIRCTESVGHTLLAAWSARIAAVGPGTANPRDGFIEVVPPTSGTIAARRQTHGTG